MNKVLDEMAAEVINGLSNDTEEYYIPDEFIEKFGEFIVKMCAEIVEDLKDHRVPASEYADNIREHFGIKQ